MTVIITQYTHWEQKVCKHATAYIFTRFLQGSCLPANNIIMYPSKSYWLCKKLDGENKQEQRRSVTSASSLCLPVGGLLRIICNASCIILLFSFDAYRHWAPYFFYCLPESLCRKKYLPINPILTLGRVVTTYVVVASLYGVGLYEKKITWSFFVAFRSTYFMPTSEKDRLWIVL